jgi:diguanylate cyclase (GGDEF)-like protein
MEIRLYLQILRRGWWIILATTLTAVIVALTASFLATPQYEAIAHFIITPSVVQTTGRPDVLLQGLNTIDNVTTTYAQVMSSARIYTDAMAFLGLQPSDLNKYSYKASVIPNSSVLELSVSGPDPQMTAKLANAIGFATISFTRNLNQIINIDFLDTAVPPTAPTSPQPMRDAGLALLLGLIVGAALAIFSEQFRLSFDTIQRRLHMDNVTGVYTGKYFPTLVAENLSKNPQSEFAVGIVELTGLSDLLDSIPIVSLQRVLRIVTEILHRELRGNDVVGRWNDISFIIMLPGTTGPDATGIFERIFLALSGPIDLGPGGLNINLDVHIGGAEYGSGVTVQEYLQKVSKALDQTRRDHNDRVHVMSIREWQKEK